ncbi:PTS sugar transporter subunit IIA [Halobellus ordinarius]|jgi:PTS system galactitol-specific IIA component|uniref:PTS sugar transporter subunit IIA n=1 Tax=Halobellus ordinarius TaxID=3075120 RepID=UPI0028803D2E|nr:PTS sugar transporter subunit IIA [Halobellus sp. ZY16]
MHTEHLTLTGASHERALEELGAYVVERGYAESEYVDALLEREASYPTGLDIPTAEFGLAIPHADPEYVSEQAVIVGFPEDTLTFQSMDDPDKTVDVDVVILLLVTETEGYTTFLSSLTKLFQDDEFVRLARERDGDALLDLITDRCLDST